MKNLGSIRCRDFFNCCCSRRTVIEGSLSSVHPALVARYHLDFSSVDPTPFHTSIIISKLYPKKSKRPSTQCFVRILSRPFSSILPILTRLLQYVHVLMSPNIGESRKDQSYQLISNLYSNISFCYKRETTGTGVR